MKQDPKKIDRDFAEIDKLLDKLKLDWDRFFGGGSRVPPYQFQSIIENRFKKYRDTSELTYSQNFKLTTLNSKFTKLKERCERMLKLRDEGITPGAKPVYAEPEPSSVSGSEKEVEQKAGSDESSRYQELFEQYIAAREKCGESVAQLKADAFAETVEKQKRQIQEKLKGRDVEFYVAIEDGKTKLKARPK